MPATEVLFYQDDDGSVPVLDWLHALRERDERAIARIEKYEVNSEAHGFSYEEENEDG